jgi:hypothetical protein
MLDGGRDLVAEAREEYERTGTLEVSTFAELTGQGYEAEVLMAQWESGIANEEES